MKPAPPNLRLFLVASEVFRNPGGIQCVNRLLLHAWREFAARTPLYLELFSYTDVPDDPLAAADCGSDVRYHAFDRRRGAMAWRLAARGRAVLPHLILFTHVNLLRLAPFVRLAAPRARIAVLGHGVEIWEPLPGAIRRALQRADFVVTPSAYTRNRTAHANGVDPARITVIPHGLDLDLNSWGERPASPPDAAPVLLSVSRLDSADAYKGIDVAIKALPLILQSFPQARYVIGGDGTDRVRLEKLAADLGVISSVEFRGEVRGRAVHALYQRADLFVLHSQLEGFGLVFAEAMAHGLAVVAADSAAAPEVVLDGVTGTLVPPNDPARLASAITELLAAPERRAQMGRAGRQRVKENFLFPHFAARWSRWLAAALPEAVYLARLARSFSTVPGPSLVPAEKSV